MYMSMAGTVKRRNSNARCSHKEGAASRDPDLDGLYESVIRVHAATWEDGSWRYVGALTISGCRYWIYGDDPNEFHHGARQAHKHALSMAHDPPHSTTDSSSSSARTQREPRQWVVDYDWPRTMPEGFSWISPFIPARTERTSTFFMVEPDPLHTAQYASVFAINGLY